MDLRAPKLRAGCESIDPANEIIAFGYALVKDFEELREILCRDGLYLELSRINSLQLQRDLRKDAKHSETSDRCIKELAVLCRARDDEIAFGRQEFKALNMI